jgi:hypothetical protein
MILVKAIFIINNPEYNPTGANADGKSDNIQKSKQLVLP